MRSLLPLFPVLCLIVSPAARELETHQAAEGVLGQPGFVTNGGDLPPTGHVVPVGLAVDPTSGKVFISQNVSILRYDSVAAMTNGGAAEAVFGQDSFSASLTGTGANRFGGPIYGIHVDGSGRLWVADRSNHRVLRFDNASTLSTGASADRVLGQINFNTNAAAFSATGMDSPRSVGMDPSGTLWVADSGNHRVLGFKNAAALASGSAAVIVLGQTTFNAQSSGLSQSKFDNPSGVFADSAGDLWVSDSNNRRVLRFASVTSFAANTTGPNATAVIGQNDFISNSSSLTADRFSAIYPVAVDAKGNLYVPAISQRRVLVFPDARSLSSGGTASIVLGQPDFTTAAAVNPPTARSLDSPTAVALDAESNLWVVDSGNNRAMRFRTIFNTVKLTAKPAQSAIAPGGIGKVRFLARNTTSIPGDFTFSSKGKKGGGFVVTFSLAGKNVTAAVRKGTAGTRMVANGRAVLDAKVRGSAGKLKLPVTVTPVNNPEARATAKAKVTVSSL